jgi:sensor histidine kinase YesM
MKTFYSTLWLVVALFMLSLVIFESLFKNLATFFGITDASFLVIVGLIFFILIYILHLSEKVSVLSNRIQELISHNSILEKEIRNLKNIDKKIEK